MDFENEADHTAASDAVVHTERPWNAEPHVSTLINYPITPIELVYSRNHCRR